MISELRNDLKVLLIRDYDTHKVYDAVLVKLVDYDEAKELLKACDESTEEQNEWYDDEYRGFFKYLKKKHIWCKRIAFGYYNY